MTIATPPKAPVKTTRDVLLAAARIIEERGWCQGDYWNHDGRVCLMGAISRAAFGYPVFQTATESMQSFLGEMRPEYWNDRPGRTAAEVIAALREAADAA